MKIISFLSTPAPHFHIYNFFSVAVACHKFIHIFLKDAKANEPIWEIKLKLNFEARQWERVCEREKEIEEMSDPFQRILSQLYLRQKNRIAKCILELIKW